MSKPDQNAGAGKTATPQVCVPATTLENDEGDLNVKAFLKLIRFAEHGDAWKDNHDEEYYRMFGKKLRMQVGFLKHPCEGRAEIPDEYADKREAMCRGLKGQKAHSPAGAYQILLGTWKRYKAKLCLGDFSPANQDAVAIELLRDRKAYHLIRAGKIKEAIEKLGKEWSSLPTGKEKRVNMDQALAKFESLKSEEKARAQLTAPLPTQTSSVAMTKTSTRTSSVTMTNTSTRTSSVTMPNTAARTSSAATPTPGAGQKLFWRTPT